MSMPTIEDMVARISTKDQATLELLRGYTSGVCTGHFKPKADSETTQLAYQTLCILLNDILAGRLISTDNAPPER